MREQEARLAQTMTVSQQGVFDLHFRCRSTLMFVRERSSRGSQSRISTQTLSMPITDLERRLSVERTLDIFTMTPKVGSHY